ncbi:MAG: TlpA disulfide reductase family protein [Isosphaeraceae bacterium]
MDTHSLGAEPPPPTPPPRRHWRVVGVLLAAWLALVAFLTFGPRRSGEGPDLRSPARLRVTDYAWSLRDLDGKPVDFAEFRGKVVFANIWASWCPPCRAEMPSIGRLAQAVGDRDAPVEFVLIGVNDSPEKLRRFLDSVAKDFRPGVRFLVADGVPPAFESDGIPATFVIGPDGRFLIEQIGSAEWDRPEVVEYLTRLAAGPAEKS